jgi:putative inorganic carbon (hco3(-)) transporter
VQPQRSAGYPARTASAASRTDLSRVPLGDHAPLKSGFPFALFLVFVVVSLLNLGVRFEWLGAARPTVVLVALLAIVAIASGAPALARVRSNEAKILGILLIYVLVTLPFVTFPGSILRFNLELFVRAAVFFFFTAIFVDSERRLAAFVFVYVVAQLVRTLEPLYLHVTEGYWGGRTYLGEGEFMGRLAGVPSDTLNPNGLGFLAVSVLPFLFFWAAAPGHMLRKILAATLAGALFYVIVLTSSRSAMIALVVLVLAISYFVRRRVLFLASVLGATGFSAAFLWSGDQVARFAGLFGGGGAGGATARGRIDGILSDVNVWLQAPIFGHGLGTSLEANWNLAGAGYVSHNLYTEALITLGLIGAAIFVRFLYCIWKSALTVYGMTQNSGATDAADVMTWLPKAMVCLIAMCAVFSLSSYGVLEYYWYLFAGLAAVLTRLAFVKSGSDRETASPPERKTDARRANRTLRR